jgi:hypothetical protein
MNTRHPLALPRKPAGQPTRGKTAANRLRRVDNFLLRYEPALLQRESGAYAGAFFVDLGYGAEPLTTLESAARLRRLNPILPILGVEIDPERVAIAQPYADSLTCFRLGGFNLPLQTKADGNRETVRAIRAFNVLRQYEVHQVGEAYDLLARHTLPGGLLIEGTSDPYGRLWVANLLRKANADWMQEALVFSTNFHAGFDPTDFQAVLPKNYLHRVVPGEAIYAFCETWKRARQETASMQAWGQRQWFMASAHKLAERGFRVTLQRKWLTKGYLLWEGGG